MSYCQRCGEKNLPHADFCENCGTPLPVREQELPCPGYRYDIHKTNCRHRLKIEPMSPTEKLSLLGSKQILFLGNLVLMAVISIFLLTNIFRSGNPLLKDIMNEKAGLFGPKGGSITGLYFLGFIVAVLFTVKPLFTRNTYNTIQLLPVMLLEFLLFPLVGIAIWKNYYFGDYMGTVLTINGAIVLLLAVVALAMQISLIRGYRKLKRMGIYPYVAN